MSSLNYDVVFVAGVHGVGKSTLCGSLGETLGLMHLSAGDVIKSEIKAAQVASKRVKDVTGNQNALLNGLIRVDCTNTLILDGHFTLLDKDCCITNIEKSVFERINLIGVIVVEDKPEKIRERLMLRDSTDVDVSFIEEHQLCEIANGKNVCEELNIPMLISSLDRSDDMLSFISCCLDN